VALVFIVIAGAKAISKDPKPKPTILNTPSNPT